MNKENLIIPIKELDVPKTLTIKKLWKMRNFITEKIAIVRGDLKIAFDRRREENKKVVNFRRELDDLEDKLIEVIDRARKRKSE